MFQIDRLLLYQLHIFYIKNVINDSFFNLKKKKIKFNNRCHTMLNLNVIRFLRSGFFNRFIRNLTWNWIIRLFLSQINLRNSQYQ